MRPTRTRALSAAVAAALLTSASSSGAARADTEALPVDPAVLAQAQSLHSLPCGGGGRAGGFAPDEDAPAAWRLAGALVSVRRKQGDRIAFVLAAPGAGRTGGAGADCAVRDVIVLPRGGTLLACALGDDSVRGLGVHAVLPSGRRDLLFWRADAAGALRQEGVGPDDDDIRLPKGELVCALPDLAE